MCICELSNIMNRRPHALHCGVSSVTRRWMKCSFPLFLLLAIGSAYGKAAAQPAPPIVGMVASTSSMSSTKSTFGETFRAGVSAVDISPTSLPALRSGGFLQASCDRVVDPLYARCLAISDGTETIVIVIVDSCMFPATLCDEIKRLATTADRHTDRSHPDQRNAHALRTVDHDDVSGYRG